MHLPDKLPHGIYALDFESPSSVLQKYAIKPITLGHYVIVQAEPSMVSYSCQML